MKNFIQKYALAIVAVVTILTFSAFKATGVKTILPMTVAIYFHGNTSNNTEVEDESKWTILPNGQSCNNINHKACMQHVEDSDLTAGVLNPTQIELGSFDSGVGYVPTRIGGSSSTTFTAINRQ